ncbi:MAG: DUF3883 domain-containing protein, partial [Candidatus Bathyarchaeia archaeon]
VPLSPIGGIRFLKPPVLPPDQIPEELKKEVEEEAVKIAESLERAEGRIPNRVPESEHYDLRSVNPSTREMRIIEVKGHRGLEVYGELSEPEASLAERMGDAYWLYIVYGIGIGKPRLLRFRDPLRTMNWKVFERVEKRKRYFVWPRD